MREVNSTYLSLVPKVDNPSSLLDFRLIACCNTLYKCISKIIADWLKRVVYSLVGKVQTTFIKGRRIVDYILIAQEFLKGYHRGLDVQSR